MKITLRLALLRPLILKQTLLIRISQLLDFSVTFLGEKCFVHANAAEVQSKQKEKTREVQY